MANLTQFTGSFPSLDNGEHVIQRFVTEADYEAIALVSDPMGVINMADPNYDPEFNNTLYYISE